MKKRPRESRDAWKVWGPLVLLALAGFAITFLFLEPPPPKRFSLAAGNPDGAYHAFAERYREVLGHHGYELEIVATAGSVENLELLRRAEVDLALLQGGVAVGEMKAPAREAEAVASVFLEAVWVFYRSELGLSELEDLRGLRVSIGAVGSGTRALALELLADLELDESDLRPVELGAEEARDALHDGRVDAAVFVSSAQADWIAPLLADPGVELLEIRRRRAFEVRHRFLTPVTLGRGVIDLPRDLPARDVPMMAAAAFLAVRDDLPASLVPLIVETLKTVHADGGPLEETGTFPSARWVDLPLMSEARHYLERGPSFLYRVLPFRAASMIDRLKILLLPLLTLLFPLLKAAPPIYRWRIRSKIFRWYEDLKTWDDALLEELPPDELAARIDNLERLEREVIAEVSVPLSYMDELYRLREHIHLVIARMEELRRSEARESTSKERSGSGSVDPETVDSGPAETGSSRETP
jgi:TRAP transporter TAXI family solute receptor